MNRIAGRAVAALAALTLTACSVGPSPSGDETAAWGRFANLRQAESALSDDAGPHSISQYILGANDGSGYEGVDGAYTGWFIDASEHLGADGQERVYGTFHVDGQIVGKETGDIVIDIGPAFEASIDMADAVRGAGTAVVFVTRQGHDYRLVDRSFSIATTDKDGRLSMPLVAPDREGDYLRGLIDVADIAALAIAGRLDKSGQLGDDGISDNEQSLIDKANELAGNG